MLKRLLTGLALWTLIVGGGLALSEKSVPASQADVTTQAVRTVPDTLPSAPDMQSAPPLDQQIMAFERHARVDMILYTGRFGQGDLAGMQLRNDLPAIALALKAPGK